MIDKANLGLSGKVAIFIAGALAAAGVLSLSNARLASKRSVPSSTTGVVGRVEIVNQATGSVTTNADGLVIIHDRDAQINFVPAKSGTNNEVATSGPILK